MDRFPDRKTVEGLRQEYPAGCRIVVDGMDDPMAPAPGTQGTVRFVDDAGSLVPSWDTGGSLSVLFGIDRCHKIRTEEEALATLNHYGRIQKAENARCPRCGRQMEGPTSRQALSTWAEIMICPLCGMLESIERMKPEKRKPLMEWAAITGPQEGEGPW